MGSRGGAKRRKRQRGTRKNTQHNVFTVQSLKPCNSIVTVDGNQVMILLDRLRLSRISSTFFPALGNRVEIKQDVTHVNAFFLKTITENSNRVLEHRKNRTCTERVDIFPKIQAKSLNL